MPWVANNASVRRSMPKATQPVCMTSPAALRRFHTVAEMIAVIVEAHTRGRLGRRRTGTSSSNFSACSIWLIAMSLPPRPKKASLAGRCGSAGPSRPAISGRACHPVPRGNPSTWAGVPIRTYSRMRKDCRRSRSREGSRRKQSPATSNSSPVPEPRRGRRQRIDRVAGGRRQHEIAGGPSSWSNLRHPRSARWCCDRRLRHRGGSRRSRESAGSFAGSPTSPKVFGSSLAGIATLRRPVRDGARSGPQWPRQRSRRRRARVNPVDPRRQQQRFGDGVERRFRFFECYVHECAPNLAVSDPVAQTPSRVRKPARRPTSRPLPRLARMRSLLIMIGEESMSRRWRPTQKSPSLR